MKNVKYRKQLRRLRNELTTEQKQLINKAILAGELDSNENCVYTILYGTFDSKGAMELKTRTKQKRPIGYKRCTKLEKLWIHNPEQFLLDMEYLAKEKKPKYRKQLERLRNALTPEQRHRLRTALRAGEMHHHRKGIYKLLFGGFSSSEAVALKRRTGQELRSEISKVSVLEDLWEYNSRQFQLDMEYLGQPDNFNELEVGDWVKTSRGKLGLVYRIFKGDLLTGLTVSLRYNNGRDYEITSPTTLTIVRKNNKPKDY